MVGTYLSSIAEFALCVHWQCRSDKIDASLIELRIEFIVTIDRNWHTWVVLLLLRQHRRTIFRTTWDRLTVSWKWPQQQFSYYLIGELCLIINYHLLSKPIELHRALWTDRIAWTTNCTADAVDQCPGKVHAKLCGDSLTVYRPLNDCADPKFRPRTMVATNVPLANRPHPTSFWPDPDCCKHRPGFGSVRASANTEFVRCKCSPVRCPQSWHRLIAVRTLRPTHELCLKKLSICENVQI